MPDFFDRLIARGTQQAGGGPPAPGAGPPAPGAGPRNPARLAARANHPGSGSAVTFAHPRLPGPFERFAPEPRDPFLEAADEAREVDAVRPEAARTRSALGNLAGTQAGITPPLPLRDSAIERAQGRALTVSSELQSANPNPSRQAPLPPGVTLTPPSSALDVAAQYQPTAHASHEAAERDQERDAQARTTSRPEHPTVQPSPPRTLAVPVSLVRAVRAAADEARTAQAQPAPAPVVVRIGRIEVRNTSPDRHERQGKKRTGRAAPKHTLADYLAAASGGRNGSASTGGGR